MHNRVAFGAFSTIPPWLPCLLGHSNRTERPSESFQWQGRHVVRRKKQRLRDWTAAWNDWRLSCPMPMCVPRIAANRNAAVSMYVCKKWRLGGSVLHVVNRGHTKPVEHFLLQGYGCQNQERHYPLFVATKVSHVAHAHILQYCDDHHRAISIS